MEKTIFRKKSLERIASPDQLDDYLKVSGSSVWVLVAALLMILTAAGVWCFWGRIPTTVSGIGLHTETETVCFVKAADSQVIEPGMAVRLAPVNTERILTGKVVGVGKPLPAAAAGKKVDAGWLAMPANWVCPVTVQPQGGALRTGTACEVSVILDERRPIELLLGR